jgi:HAD superfamily hydrolase (TIGR01484 family)
MSPSIKLVCTDFDGTLFAEFENPPVPRRLEALLARLQAEGSKWVINTGRDLSSLLETLGRAHLSIKPDFLVLVEREIYRHISGAYVEHGDWNQRCHSAHAELFRKVRDDLPRITDWIRERFNATVYEDFYSPFCLIAEKLEDAEAIHRYLDDYSATIPDLSVVRNDIYARFSHVAFNKGTALSEVARLLSVQPSEIFVAGDHLNDLPMLSLSHAHWLAAPANAVDLVKSTVLDQQGRVSDQTCGNGVADALEQCLDASSRAYLGNGDSASAT